MHAAPNEVFFAKPHLKGQRATERKRKFGKPKTVIIRARVPVYIHKIIEAAFSLRTRGSRIYRPDFVGEYLQCQMKNVCEDFFPGLTADEVAALQAQGYTLAQIERTSRQRVVDRRAVTA